MDSLHFYEQLLMRIMFITGNGITDVEAAAEGSTGIIV